jgi:hypothetical protein
MDTLNFLQRVLPLEGLYVATVINPDGNKQGFFSSVEELAKAVAGLDQRGNNTYFAISAFLEKGSRKQDNVRATKLLALDVDCGEGKPYADRKEGLRELAIFLTKSKLPKPMIVSSGNGLHVYWVLDRELSPDEWKPLAEGLKQSASTHGFNVDAGLTANSALVLRPVGTRNPKNGRTVTLLMDAEPVSVEAMRVLGDFRTGAGKSPRSNLAESLKVEAQFPPSNATLVAAKCQQIHWAVNNQSEVHEPNWYNLLGIAAYCADADAVAISWSENHPKFSPEHTLSKLQQWKAATTGPTTCAKFESDRPGGCKGCKFKDKIGSPARLGLQYQEVQVTQDADPIAATIPIPRPYKRTADGIKATIDDTDIDVCKFDVYPVSYGRDESLGYEVVRYHWKRPHIGWQELALRQAYLAEGSREFPGAIADQGIVLNGKSQTGFFQHMLRSYMDELRHQRTMTNLYATMGWKENFTQFVIGDTIFRRNPDGVVSEDTTTLAATSSKLGNDLYGVAGNVKEWTDFTRLTERAQLDTHMFALCVSLSSPLYAFTGLKGLTVSLYGPTGGGKTLAQLWMQSVWGCPEKLHFSAKFTQNTLFSRMGLYANMPMTIDEATMMADKEVGDFLYWVSQGRDKARLNRNAEERDAKTFAMPVTVSTNKSLASKLIASGLDTDAQMARLLEVSIRPSPLFVNDSDAGRKIYEFINKNYGYAGRLFIKNLLELGPQGIRAAIENATATFQTRYKCKFAGEERYWEQAIVLADLAGTLATQWGIINYDHTKGIDWVLAQMGAIRKTAAENKTDSFDLIAEYLSETADKALTVFHQNAQKPTVDFARLPRTSVYVRFDLYRKTMADYFDSGTVTFDRVHLRRWMSMRGADYKTFIQELTDENVLVTPKSQKAYLGKDSPIKLGQTYVVGVNLNHPRLQGILDKENHHADDVMLGQLRTV